MSKTFKSVTDNESELDVRANDCGVFIAFSRAGQIRQASTFAPSDAPALALAVLEAAFGDDQPAPNKIGEAWAALYVHIAEQERAATEAEAQAELEAEALELINAYRASFLHCAPEDGFEGSDDPEAVKAKWLAVARRAREMRNEKKETTND